MEKKRADEAPAYFKCDHCSQEFSLYSFRIAVFLYGIILLANKQNGYVGIICPKCMKTTLKKIETARFEEIKKELGERIVIIYDVEAILGREVSVRSFGKPDPQSDILAADIDIVSMERCDLSISSMSSTLAFQTVSSLKYENINIEPSSENSINALCNDHHFQSDFESFQCWPKDYKEESVWHGQLSEVPNNHSQYTLCSRPIKVPADQTLCRVYWFKEEDVQKLVDLENKEELKIFPRHFYDSSIRKPCEEFYAKAGLMFKYYRGVKEQEKRQKNRFSKHSSKEKLSANFGFIETLEDEDFLDLDDSDGIGLSLWKSKDPFKDKGVPSSFKGIDLAALEQYSIDIDRKKMISDIWSNFTKDHVQKILSKMLFEFFLEFRELKNRKDCSTGAIWELKQKYLLELYDSLSSPTKRRKIATHSPDAVLKEVRKAEERFKGVKIISQDYRIHEIKIRIANHYVLPEKGRIDILILGETGTGKELIAKACHEASNRAGPLIPVNIGSAPHAHFDNELFGHVKGAYTGADRETKGIFKEANGGTVFLDEIGDLELNSQGKLFRVIQEREIKPVGAARPQTVNVMLIMATNKDLLKGVEDKRFREDLFYRIRSDVIITIPPLRDRQNDIPLLIKHFVQEEDWKRKQDSNLPELKFSQDCLKVFKKMPWDGNVRQLQSVVKRIVNNRIDEGSRSEIMTEDIPDEDLQQRPRSKNTVLQKGQRDKTELTSENIRKALRNNKAVIAAAAREMGYTREHLQRTIKKMGIEPKQFIEK